MKKIASFLFKLVLVFCLLCALPLAAEAKSAETRSGLEVSLITDKDAYLAGEEVQVTVQIKNTNTFKVENVSIETLLPDGWHLKSGNQAETNVTIEAGGIHISLLTAVPPDEVEDPVTSEAVSETETSSGTETAPQTDVEDITDELSDTEETPGSENTTATTDKITEAPQTDDTAYILIGAALLAAATVCIFLAAKYKKGARILSLFLCVAMGLAMASAAKTDTYRISVDKSVAVGDNEYTITSTVRWEVNMDEDEVSLKISDKDISEFTIVLPENASESQQTAASELAAYLLKISNFKPAIKADSEEKNGPEIVLGYTDRLLPDESTVNELGDEGFIIRTEGEDLYILGSDVRGTLYGTYTFLEDYLNCRFYSKSFEVVPKATGIQLSNIEDKQIPAFEFRDSYWNSLNTKESAAKLKVNSNHGREVSQLDASVGGGITYAQVLEGVGFVHTLPLILRTKIPSYDVYTPICFTSTENYNIVVDFVRDFLEEHPDETIISLSHNDGAGACTCQNCTAALREDSYSGLMLQFINKIAEEFEDEYPDLRFDTLAYRSTQAPPAHIKPNDNVIIRFCGIDTCFRHPISADCEEWGGGRTYDDLVAWSKLCTNGNLYIWNYTTNFTDFNMIYANFDNFWNNMQLYLELGVTGVFEQGNIASDSGEFGMLKGYVLAKLLWNPHMTEEEYWGLIDEFLVDYYGAGGLYLREFIDYTLENSEDEHFGIYFDDPGNYVYDHSYGTLSDNLSGDAARNYIEGREAFISRSQELFDNAKSYATEEQLNRINQAEIQLLNYIAFTQHKCNGYGLGTSETRERLRAANEEIYNRLKAYHITHVTEFTAWDNKLVNFDSYVLQWGWDKRSDWDDYHGPYGTGLGKINWGNVNSARPDQK